MQTLTTKAGCSLRASGFFASKYFDCFIALSLIEPAQLEEAVQLAK